MRWWTYLGGLCLFVILLVVLFGSGRAEPEVRFRELTAQQWAELLAEDARHGRDLVAQELIAGGAQSMPVLMQLTRSDNFMVRRNVMSLLTSVGPESIPQLTEYVRSGDEHEAIWALRCLMRLGTQSLPAAPEIAERLEMAGRREQPRLAEACEGALLEIGPDAAEWVAPLAENEATRGRAFRLLSNYGLQAIPHLIVLQNSRNQQVRDQAYRLILQIRSEEEALVTNFVSYDAYVRVLERSREMPVREFGRFPDDALNELGIGEMTVEEAIGRLHRLLTTSNDPMTRRLATRYLAAFGPLARETVPDLIEIVRNRRDHHRWTAATTLGAIGPYHAREAVPALAEMLQEEDGATRLHALLALGDIGVPVEGSFETMRELLIQRRDPSTAFDDVDYRRVRAAIALARLEPQRGVPVLIEELREPRWTVRRGMIGALALAGPDAVPALTQALENEEAQVRHGAAIALLKIASSSRLASVALDPYRRDEDATLAWAAEESARQFHVRAR